MRRNVRLLVDEGKLVEVLRRESVGGNAGAGHAAVNVVTTATGDIVAIGNYQDLPIHVRTDVDRGALLHWTIRVKIYGPGPGYELTSIAEYCPSARRVMRCTVRALNRRSPTHDVDAHFPRGEFVRTRAAAAPRLSSASKLSIMVVAFLLFGGALLCPYTGHPDSIEGSLTMVVRSHERTVHGFVAATLAQSALLPGLAPTVGPICLLFYDALSAQAPP